MGTGPYSTWPLTLGSEWSQLDNGWAWKRQLTNLWHSPYTLVYLPGCMIFCFCACLTVWLCRRNREKNWQCDEPRLATQVSGRKTGKRKIEQNVLLIYCDGGIWGRREIPLKLRWLHIRLWPRFFKKVFFFNTAALLRRAALTAWSVEWKECIGDTLTGHFF